MGVLNICDKRKSILLIASIYFNILFFSGNSMFNKKPYLKPTQVDEYNILRCSK